MELVERYLKRQKLKKSYVRIMSWENRITPKKEIKLTGMRGTTAETYWMDEMHWVERRFLDGTSKKI